MSSARAGPSLASASEATVVGLAVTGDSHAFAELVRRRQGYVRGLLRGMTGNASTADDLAQDTFVQAWRKIRTLRAPGAFGGWLRQIAVNAYLQQVRRWEVPLDHSVLPEERGTASNEQKVDLELDLEKALAQLRPVERICIVLSYQEGLSHSEIVELTRLPSGTVKSHISRGAARLRHSLATETAP